MSGYKAYDYANDPAPDVYKVERTADGNGFDVEHFRHRDDTRPCCRCTVIINDDDRQDVDGPEFGALRRSARIMDAHHAKTRPASSHARTEGSRS